MTGSSTMEFFNFSFLPKQRRLLHALTPKTPRPREATSRSNILRNQIYGTSATMMTTAAAGTAAAMTFQDGSGPKILIQRLAGANSWGLTTMKRRMPSSSSIAQKQPRTRIASNLTSNKMKTYRLTGTGGPGPSVTAMAYGREKDSKHVILTDLPQPMGGRDTAPQPIELLLGALMGCTQATALFVARQYDRSVQWRRITYDIHAERDPRGAIALPISSADKHSTRPPSRLQRIAGTVTFHMVEKTIPDEALKEMKEQTERRCPIANMMIASGCEMDIEWRQLLFNATGDQDEDL